MTTISKPISTQSSILNSFKSKLEEFVHEFAKDLSDWYDTTATVKKAKLTEKRYYVGFYSTVGVSTGKINHHAGNNGLNVIGLTITPELGGKLYVSVMVEEIRNDI